MFRRRIFLLILISGYCVVAVVSWPESNKATIQANDFLTITKTPKVIADGIKVACYDCHSNTTRYPFYAYFPPVSNWIQGHVNHGKGKLNFSEWDSYAPEERMEFYRTIISEIEKGDMPPSNYQLLHSNAKWKESEKEKILDFIRHLSKKVGEIQ